MSRGLYYGNSFLGRVGEPTGLIISNYSDGHNSETEIKVGDTIAFTEYDASWVRVVVKDDEGEYGVFGFGSNRLDFDDITIVLSHHKLTQEFFSLTQKRRAKSKFKIEGLPTKNMTVAEIERELGYAVKIVK